MLFSRKTYFRILLITLSMMLVLSASVGCGVLDIAGEIIDRIDREDRTEYEPVETEPPAVVIDLEELPSMLEPIEGYCPYIVRFYYTDGSLMINRAPYLVVLDKYSDSAEIYTLYDAAADGLIKGFSAYKADGTECDPNTVVRLQEAMFGEPEKLLYNGSAVYVFYLKEGIEAELWSVSESDYRTLGSLDNLYFCWGNACLERYGWGGRYRKFILEPSVDIGDGKSVTRVDITLDSYSSITDVKGVNHYYYFIEDTSYWKLPIGQ